MFDFFIMEQLLRQQRYNKKGKTARIIASTFSLTPLSGHFWS